MGRVLSKAPWHQAERILGRRACMHGGFFLLSMPRARHALSGLKIEIAAISASFKRLSARKSRLGMKRLMDQN